MLLRHELKKCSGLANSDGREHVIQSDGEASAPCPRVHTRIKDLTV